MQVVAVCITPSRMQCDILGVIRVLVIKLEIGYGKYLHSDRGHTAERKTHVTALARLVQLAPQEESCL